MNWTELNWPVHFLRNERDPTLLVRAPKFLAIFVILFWHQPLFTLYSSHCGQTHCLSKVPEKTKVLQLFYIQMNKNK